MKIRASRSWSDQEQFWAGKFGEEYIDRNQSNQLLGSNIHFFAKALEGIPKPVSCLEFGANIGMNLKALSLLFPEMNLAAIEINLRAVQMLSNSLPNSRVFEGSLLDFQPKEEWDLCVVKGVLIHIAPADLPEAYEILAKASGSYLLISEYYSPYPVEVNYRGHSDKLFKRDFVGEFLMLHPDFRLVNYGFGYHGDVAFPEDDLNWFLLKRESKNDSNKGSQ